MGFINKIEQGLEKAVRGTFSKGGGEFEPVDLANRVRTEMDNKSYSISSGRTIAPNVFTINFAADDFPRVQDWGAPLAEELCDVAIRHARSQGYSLRGSVRVTFTVNEAVEPGEFEVSSGQEKVATPGSQQEQRSYQRHEPVATRATAPRSSYREPAPQTTFDSTSSGMPNRITKPSAFQQSGVTPATGAAGTASSARAPQRSTYNEQPTQLSPQVSRQNQSYHTEHATPQVVLEINGQNYSIRSLPVVLGRGSNADITVEDTGVSRRHLEIMEQDGVYLAVDLGSTNGSFLNGQRLTGRSQLTNGAVLTMGRARIVFRLMVPRGER